MLRCVLKRFWSLKRCKEKCSFLLLRWWLSQVHGACQQIQRESPFILAFTASPVFCYFKSILTVTFCNISDHCTFKLAIQLLTIWQQFCRGKTNVALHQTVHTQWLSLNTLILSIIDPEKKLYLLSEKQAGLHLFEGLVTIFNVNQCSVFSMLAYYFVQVTKSFQILVN